MVKLSRGPSEISRSMNKKCATKVSRWRYKKKKWIDGHIIQSHSLTCVHFARFSMQSIFFSSSYIQFVLSLDEINDSGCGGVNAYILSFSLVSRHKKRFICIYAKCHWLGKTKDEIAIRLQGQRESANHLRTLPQLETKSG